MKGGGNHEEVEQEVAKDESVSQDEPTGFSMPIKKGGGSCSSHSEEQMGGRRRRRSRRSRRSRSPVVDRPASRGKSAMRAAMRAAVMSLPRTDPTTPAR